MAAGCQTLQSELAANALEHLEKEDPTMHSILGMGPSELLGIGSGSSQKRPEFDIKLPSAG